MLKAAADVFDQRRRFEASNFGVCIVMAVVDPNGAVSADGLPTPNGLGPSETPSSGSNSNTTMTRSSTRALHLMRKRESESNSHEVSEETRPDVGDMTNGTGDLCPEGGSEPLGGGKAKRTWEQWSSEDKKYFFEALNECGKNFDAIHSFIQGAKRQTAGKKRPVNNSAADHSKAKEQIRTFYYRTWHKISKYLEFPSGLKKSHCELYGLINFGEMRKKTGTGKLNEKTGAKLQQLIFEGYTTLKTSRGKTLRIKTPMCLTLKRLKERSGGPRAAQGGQLSTKEQQGLCERPGCFGASGGQGGSAVPGTGHHPGAGEHSSVESGHHPSHPDSLPSRVTIVLEPRNADAFHRVHRDCIQNPRVNVTVGLDKRLSAVISYLKSKWVPVDNLLFEKYKEASTSSGPPTTSRPHQPSDPEDLWLVPKPGSKLISPILRPIEPLTSSSLGLSNLQTKKDEEVQNRLKQSEDAEDENSSDNETSSPEAARSPLSSAETKSCHLSEVGSACRRMLFEYQADTATDGTETEIRSQTESAESAERSQYGVESRVASKIDLAQGWSSENCGDLTVGELFLIEGLGNRTNANIELTYCWRKKNPLNGAHELNPSSRSLIKALSRLTAFELTKGQRTKVTGPSSGPPLSPKPEPPTKLPLPSPASSLSQTTGPILKTPASTNLGTGSEFRRPLAPAPVSSQQQLLQQQQQAQFRQQIDMLIPKYNQSKRKPLMRSKNIVSRQLPLLQPKVHPLIKTVDGKVKVRCFPAGKSSFLSSSPKSSPQKGSLGFASTQTRIVSSQKPSVAEETPPDSSSSTVSASPSSTPTTTAASSGGLADLSFGSTPPSEAGSASPDRISGTGTETDVDIADEIDEDMDYGGGHEPGSPVAGRALVGRDRILFESYQEASNSSVLLHTPQPTPTRADRPTPPASPCFSSASSSWIPDISLNSLLGGAGVGAVSGGSTNPGGHRIATPTNHTFNLNEDSSQSTGSEVDRHILSMMTENSIDFTNKFAKLANAVNSEVITAQQQSTSSSAPSGSIRSGKFTPESQREWEDVLYPKVSIVEASSTLSNNNHF